MRKGWKRFRLRCCKMQFAIPANCILRLHMQKRYIIGDSLSTPLAQNREIKFTVPAQI
jgi:hypothetical protein